MGVLSTVVRFRQNDCGRSDGGWGDSFRMTLRVRRIRNAGTGFAFLWGGTRNQAKGAVLIESGAYGKAAEAVREKLLAMMIFEHRIPMAGGPGGAHAGDRSAQDGLREQPTEPSRVRKLLSGATLSALAAAMTRSTTRQVVTYHTATVGILGGVVCTPVISVLAWVGMVLPQNAALHQIAPMLMTAALVWLALAIILAHACRPSRERRGSIPLSGRVLK